MPKLKLFLCPESLWCTICKVLVRSSFRGLVMTVLALSMAEADCGHVKLQRSPRTLGPLVHLPKFVIQNISPVSWHDEHSKLTLGEKKYQTQWGQKEGNMQLSRDGLILPSTEQLVQEQEQRTQVELSFPNQERRCQKRHATFKKTQVSLH